MVEAQKEFTELERAIADREKLDVLIGTLKVAEQDRELTKIGTAAKTLKGMNVPLKTIIKRITAAYKGTPAAKGTEEKKPSNRADYAVWNRIKTTAAGSKKGAYTAFMAAVKPHKEANPKFTAKSIESSPEFKAFLAKK